MNSNACFCCRRTVVDNARHTLLECPTWETQRIAMVEETGQLADLADLIGAITGSREAWLAFGRFAGDVMRAKRGLETQEYARQREERSSSSSRITEVEHLLLAVRIRRPDGEGEFRLPSSSLSGSG